MLALLTMLIDHAGLALFPYADVFRCIGRISFPLYCFLLVQGFLHTSNLRSYGRRLLLLAVLSEIPFDLLIFSRISSGMEQNVLFSLLFGLMALTACDMLKGRPIEAFIVCITLAVSAMALRLSYGWLSVALCLCFYYTRGSRLRLMLCTSATLLIYTLSLVLSGVTGSWALVSLCSLFSLIPILAFNGRPGLRRPWLSFLFYAAYPAHLLLLTLLRSVRLVPPYFLQ